MKLERMDAFFEARTAIYDEHMLREVPGCREGYRQMAAALPETVESLLDLGCGTGLELAEIFRRFPRCAVTGIDLTAAMLERLRTRYAGHALTLLCADYFDCELGDCCFDAAVSFQSLHHFLPDEKRLLYRRLFRALKPGGVYIEGDYMVTSEKEAQHGRLENERLRREQGIPPEVRCHYDIPCTVAQQIALLREAGFSAVQSLYREENTTLLAAKKER